MRRLDETILDTLAPTCTGDPIHFVGLGAYDFQIGYADVQRLQTMEKAVFSIQGRTYEWEFGPCDVPAWLLVGQVPASFEITSPFALRLNLVSGDWLEFYCDDSPYETLIIDLGMKDGMLWLEIF